MAKTYTQKFQFPISSADTDNGPQRVEWDTLFSNLDAHGAYDDQGTSRPGAAASGRYYWNTSSKQLSRDDGSTWWQIGQSGTDRTATNSAVGTVAQTVVGLAGTTADLLQVYETGTQSIFKVNGSGEVSVVDLNGKSTVTLGQINSPLNVQLSSNNAVAEGVIVNAAAAFAGSTLLDVQNNGNSIFSVTKTGLLTSLDSLHVAAASAAATYKLLELANNNTDVFVVAGNGDMTNTGNFSSPNGYTRSGIAYVELPDATNAGNNVLWVQRDDIAAGLPPGDTTGAQYVFSVDGSGNTRSRGIIRGIHQYEQFTTEAAMLAAFPGAPIGTTAYLTAPTYGLPGLFIVTANGIVSPAAPGAYIGQAGGNASYSIYGLGGGLYVPVRDAKVTITFTSPRRVEIQVRTHITSGNSANGLVAFTYPAYVVGTTIPSASSSLPGGINLLGVHSTVQYPPNGGGASGVSSQQNYFTTLQPGTYTFFPLVQYVAGGSQTTGDTTEVGYISLRDAGPG